jgi:GT2 family glycosyltransferase
VKARQLHLIFVAYRTPAAEVRQMARCLAALAPHVGYAVVVNHYQPGEPIEQLASGADAFVPVLTNLGYGRAVNRAVEALRLQACIDGVPMAPWLAAMNTDLSWQPGSFEALLHWLEQRPELVLAVPEIVNPAGETQQLCKCDPTLLALLSRRFWPWWLKPSWLRRLDQHYVMRDADLSQPLEVNYLSGCCMVVRRSAFEAVGGFDPRYFLYLEDADLSRSLRPLGRCMHVPVMQVVHAWGRGNYSSLRLTLVNLHSAWLYFRKWGWRLF